MNPQVEMKALLQTVINLRSNTENVYIADDHVIDFIINLDQIKQEWNHYLKQAENSLLERNDQLISKIDDILSFSHVFNLFMRNIIANRLSSFPQLGDKLIKKVIRESEGSILKYIISPLEIVENIIKKILIEGMKSDTVKKESHEINYQPLENHLKMLLQKPKREAFVLSNALLCFDWNIQLSKEIENLILECFLQSQNKSYISKVLFYWIKREWDFYCTDFHAEVEKLKQTQEFVSVQDVLLMDSVKAAYFKEVVLNMQKNRSENSSTALTTLSSETKMTEAKQKKSNKKQEIQRNKSKQESIKRKHEESSDTRKQENPNSNTTLEEKNNYLRMKLEQTENELSNTKKTSIQQQEEEKWQEILEEIRKNNEDLRKYNEDLRKTNMNNEMRWEQRWEEYRKMNEENLKDLQSEIAKYKYEIASEFELLNRCDCDCEACKSCTQKYPTTNQ